MVFVRALVSYSLIIVLSARASANAMDFSSDPMTGTLGSTYCRNHPIQHDNPSIPWIGCFYLSAGHHAEGTFSSHHVEAGVDPTGSEIFIVDGTVVEAQTTESHTNLPFVRLDPVGYEFCEDSTSTSCPTQIAVFSRDSDKSILFLVSECFRPKYQYCVTSQEEWDSEVSRGRPH